MFQGDCLINFAIGSALAAAAGDGIRASQYKTQNKYFVFLLLHLALIVRPLNIYMLWEHTGFETLFYYDASLNGVWPALNCFGGMVCGILGYMATRKLILWNQDMMAHSLWTACFSLYFAFCSIHYDRMLYSGGIQEYYDGKTYTFKNFFKSKVFLTFVIKIFLTLAPVQYVLIYWPREEGLLTKAKKWLVVNHCKKMFTYEGCAIAAIVGIAKLSNMLPNEWGWDRLLAVTVGHVIISATFMLPLMLMSTKYTVTKRIDIRRSKQVQKPTKRRRIQRSDYPIAPTTMIVENGIQDEAWEENSEQSTQDSEEPFMNGGSNHTEFNGKGE